MKRLLLVPVAALALLAGGCGAAHESAPEPDDGSMVQLTKLQVVQMPNGFRNVAFGCIPGTKTEMFVTSRGAITGSSGTETPSSVTVIENAAYCGGTVATATN